jgi:hypothetical protein
MTPSSLNAVLVAVLAAFALTGCLAASALVLLAG